jgi:survival-of-motor-neuron-related-splicing factor 30
MADEYRAQLLAVEAKLAKEPHNEELLALKSDLIELIELEEEEEDKNKLSNTNDQTPSQSGLRGSSDKPAQRYNNRDSDGDQTIGCPDDKLVETDGGDAKTGPNQRRQLSEAELLAKKKEKNKKKKAKSRERIKEQLDTAEKVKQTWQSFANQKGLKGLTKKSIFASPCSITGKVGVGTNGIADAPISGARMGGASSSSAPTSSAPITKRRRY